MVNGKFVLEGIKRSTTAVIAANQWTSAETFHYRGLRMANEIVVLAPGGYVQWPRWYENSFSRPHTENVDYSIEILTENFNTISYDRQSCLRWFECVPSGVTSLWNNNDSRVVNCQTGKFASHCLCSSTCMNDYWRCTADGDPVVCECRSSPSCDSSWMTNCSRTHFCRQVN